MYRPPQCTERERDGTWENCTEASGIMLYNAANKAAVAPSTEEETAALRRLGGRPQTGGANLQDLQEGMRARYGWAPNRIGPPGTSQPAWSTVLSHLANPGDCAVLQGGMSAWPRTSHWNRWDTGFRGSHAVYVQREDDLARLWWMNPLAPASYGGEWISLTEARRYYLAFIGGAALARVGQLTPPDTGTGDDDMPNFAVPGRYMARFDAGTDYFDKPGGTRIGDVEAGKFFDLTGQDTETDPDWYELDGGSAGLKRWARASDIAERIDLIDTVIAQDRAKARIVYS